MYCKGGQGTIIYKEKYFNWLFSDFDSEYMIVGNNVTFSLKPDIHNVESIPKIICQMAEK